MEERALQLHEVEDRDVTCLRQILAAVERAVLLAQDAPERLGDRILIVDADLDRPLRDPAIAKEHTGLSRATGRIGVQSHNERVEFRNLRVKELK
jgi:hypothetical protein